MSEQAESSTAGKRPAGGLARPVPPAATVGPVHIVGAGLLGASIGVALRGWGVEVTLADISPMALALAVEVGAGRPRQADDAAPALIVVATPPDVTGPVVLAELAAHPGAVVTDVASVKAAVLADVMAGGGDLTRYVGSHPMAGRERGGAARALADLFAGRPWIIADSGSSSRAALLAVRDLAVDLGATVVHMAAAEHDAAVALVSHLPQLAASLVAARLAEAAPGALELAGQGLRDVTRIAASDPALWATILAGNAEPVASLLRQLRADLDGVIVALDEVADGAEGRALRGLHQVIAAGNDGVGRIPGKHGGQARSWDVVTVLVPDQPGELGRLFAAVGASGINLEDVKIEHSAGKPVGLTALSVAQGRGGALWRALAAAGWKIVA